eukprot:3681938-Pleurochrysis_carterae.AAC.1
MLVPHMCMHKPLRKPNFYVTALFRRFKSRNYPGWSGTPAATETMAAPPSVPVGERQQQGVRGGWAGRRGGVGRVAQGGARAPARRRRIIDDDEIDSAGGGTEAGESIGECESDAGSSLTPLDLSLSTPSATASDTSGRGRVAVGRRGDRPSGSVRPPTAATAARPALPEAAPAAAPA